MYKARPEVEALRRTLRRAKVDIKKELLQRIPTTTAIDVKALMVMREQWVEGDITKVRFDEKVKVAEALKLITPSLARDLVDLFSPRNSIHLHAEIRKGLAYELDLSRRAYRRIKPFRSTLVARLKVDGKLKAVSIEA